jgi:hypothetical protein
VLGRKPERIVARLGREKLNNLLGFLGGNTKDSFDKNFFLFYFLTYPKLGIKVNDVSF